MHYFPSAEQVDDCVINGPTIEERFAQEFDQPKPLPRVVGRLSFPITVDASAFLRAFRTAEKQVRRLGNG